MSETFASAAQADRISSQIADALEARAAYAEWFAARFAELKHLQQTTHYISRAGNSADIRAMFEEEFAPLPEKDIRDEITETFWDREHNNWPRRAA